MSDLLANLESIYASLTPEKAAIIQQSAIFKEYAKKVWVPNLGPQCQAYVSRADWLYFGGQAGGGKTDLLLGLAMTSHQKSAIFRQAYDDLSAIIDRLVA